MGAQEGDGRVTGGADKVEASMNAEVRLVSPQRLLLLSHVCLMLVIDEVDDRRPRVAVVDVVTKAGVSMTDSLALNCFSSNSALIISTSVNLSSCLR
jgi:hypothetical protein